MGSSVKHLLIDENMRFDRFARERLHLSPGQLHFYHRFGCFYLNKERLLDVKTELARGDYLRFHLSPRRFQVTHLDWRGRIVFEDDELLIADKPAGLPVHPTLDNLIENLLFQLRVYTGNELLITHRLDINTSGLVILAKTKTAVGKINRWFEEGGVAKKYRARVPAADLGCREYVDFMKPQKTCPKEMAAGNPGGWKECRLKILHRRNLEAIDELDIQLLTGRTHQIRAQLAFHRAPILGDQLYGSPFDIFGEPCRLPLGRQNSRPIALCCYSLELPDGRRWEITPTFDKPS